MEFEIKFKSITRRWVTSVYLPVVIIVFIIALIACTVVRNSYLRQVQSEAEEYAKSFSQLSGIDSDYFSLAAKEYCEQFEAKDKIEIMIISADGDVIVSTSGFERRDLPMPDYEKALLSEAGKSFWIGRSTADEKILAGTYILKDTSGSSNGAVRYVVSLYPCNMRILYTCIIIIITAFAILVFTAMSGLFFVKSIIRPVRDVSATARRIASGDHKEALKSQYNDEIGELCDSINYMETELQNAEKLKNDFISSVSHELRTPLTAIRGWAETAKMSVGFDDGLVNRGLDVVLSESDRLSNLVEELLDFSRIQSGRFSLNIRPFEVSELLESAASMYIELAAKRNIDVTYTKGRNDVIVNGDPDRIKQVFINIIDNAVKYTEEKGQVLIQQSEEEGCVKITVKDTGVGIPAQDVDHVKEKFYKANNSVRGSGIGLAVADEIIKQHQGLIFLESTEGVGTTVTVVLPTVIPEPEETEKILPPIDEKEENNE
ncbi:MAG: HAMP domain-containing sensor histidine kinase [Acutalibacteraceae bacterium]|nr:HAMP domain-containing sensor histidine kinase [Acutalibacteraceae bacterium]